MEANAKGTPMSSRKIGGLAVNKEDANENKVEKEEEEKGGTFYPYDRLTTSSTDPAPNIDVAKREVCFNKKKREIKYC